MHVEGFRWWRKVGYVSECRCWALKTGLDAEYHVTHAKSSIPHLGPTTNSVWRARVMGVLSTTRQFHVNQEKTGEEFALIHALQCTLHTRDGACATRSSKFAALF